MIFFLDYQPYRKLLSPLWGMMLVFWAVFGLCGWWFSYFFVKYMDKKLNNVEKHLAKVF